jgi:hypothetical protein
MCCIALAYKNHDKKTDCNTEHRPCILAVLAVLWRWLVRLCLMLMFIDVAGLCTKVC